MKVVKPYKIGATSVSTQTVEFIGSFGLWHENVDVFAWRERDGAELYLDPDRGRPGRIKVGLCQSWSGVIECLVHEAFEYMCHRMGFVYKSCNRYVSDTSAVTFMFDHPQYLQMCGVLGQFLGRILPVIQPIWFREKRKREKKGK